MMDVKNDLVEENCKNLTIQNNNGFLEIPTDELEKLLDLSDSENDAEVDYSATKPEKSSRNRFCSVSEIADKIAHPGESPDSAKTRALCFSHVYKGRYSVDIRDDKELDEWRQKLEEKMKNFGESSEIEPEEVHEEPNPGQYRKRAHSMMACVGEVPLLRRRRQNHQNIDEDFATRAARYRAEYLANRKKQNLPDLKEMDENESKLLDKAIAHLIAIESQVKPCRVPSNSVCENNSPANTKFGKGVPTPPLLQRPRKKGFRRRIRQLWSRFRQLFEPRIIDQRF
uniref:Uncharacterized protein n=1 Tax=Panagrolaimus sp. JU765 TaxID=591449 RepID=A0AC34R5P1_9BILA